MQTVTLKLTVEELKLLATLASDQLFRREFIDPRMPGRKPDPAETDAGKALVVRMRALVDRDFRTGAPQPSVPTAHDAGGPVRLRDKVPDAL